jgi:hypothetical protein
LLAATGCRGWPGRLLPPAAPRRPPASPGTPSALPVALAASPWLSALAHGPAALVLLAGAPALASPLAEPLYTWRPERHAECRRCPPFADIMYSTGETEVLNLDEIAQDGHMSLIESW